MDNNVLINDNTLKSNTIVNLQNIHFSEHTLNSIRKSFVTKVYSIVWFQLFLTSIFIVLCEKVDSIKSFMLGDIASSLAVVFFYLELVLLCLFMCGQDNIKERSIIENVAFLSFLTIPIIFYMGMITSYYSINIILISSLSSLIIFSGLTLYAFQSKIDYTAKGGLFIISLLSFILFGIFNIFFKNNILQIIYSIVGAVIFSGYIVFDTQLIIGGKSKYQLAPNDYIIGAISLYLDIINLFIFILNLTSATR